MKKAPFCDFTGVFNAIFKQNLFVVLTAPPILAITGLKSVSNNRVKRLNLPHGR